MKRILITATVLFLTALFIYTKYWGTNKPILNMAANLAPSLDVDLSDNTAALKKKYATAQWFYHLYWYNTQGCNASLAKSARESQSGNIFFATARRKCLNYQNQAQKAPIIDLFTMVLCPY